jgi:hypothetical protein
MHFILYYFLLFYFTLFYFVTFCGFYRLLFLPHTADNHFVNLFLLFSGAWRVVWFVFLERLILAFMPIKI